MSPTHNRDCHAALTRQTRDRSFGFPRALIRTNSDLEWCTFMISESRLAKTLFAIYIPCMDASESTGLDILELKVGPMHKPPLSREKHVTRVVFSAPSPPEPGENKSGKRLSSASVICW